MFFMAVLLASREPLHWVSVAQPSTIWIFAVGSAFTSWQVAGQRLMDAGFCGSS